MNAEQQFRAAFERLKKDEPETLSKGSLVTQNNVAREAGKDPSALRKARFPSLIAEIQRYVTSDAAIPPPSKRQTRLKNRKENRTLKTQLEDVTKQRDMLASLLLEADQKILDLRDEVTKYKGKLPPSNVTKFPRSSSS